MVEQTEAEIIEITKLIGETYVPYWQITIATDKLPNLKLGKAKVIQEEEHENKTKKRIDGRIKDEES